MFLGLLFLRLRYLPVFPEGMAFWAPVLVLVLGMGAWPGLLASQDGRSAGRAIALGQSSWLALALVLPVGAATVGALNFLVWQVVVRQSLQRLLEAEGSSRPWLLLAAFLVLAGAPLSALFSAYFFLLAPFMSVGDGVASMHARLFTGTGLLAGVATLAVVYQTGALSYFYWTRVFDAERTPPRTRRTAVLLWVGLALAAWGGLQRVALNDFLRALAVSAGAKFS